MFVYAEEVEEDHEGPGGQRMAAEDPGELSCQGLRVTVAPRGACTASSSSWSSNAGDGWSGVEEAIVVVQYMTAEVTGRSSMERHDTGSHEVSD